MSTINISINAISLFQVMISKDIVYLIFPHPNVFFHQHKIAFHSFRSFLLN